MALNLIANNHDNISNNDTSVVTVGGSLQQNEAFEDLDLNKSSGQVGIAPAQHPESNMYEIQTNQFSNNAYGITETAHAAKWVPQPPLASESGEKYIQVPQEHRQTEEAGSGSTDPCVVKRAKGLRPDSHVINVSLFSFCGKNSKKQVDHLHLR